MKRFSNFVLVFTVIVLSFLAVSCFDSSDSISERIAYNGSGRVSVKFSNEAPDRKNLTTSISNMQFYGVENCYWRYTAVMEGNASAAGTQTSETTITDTTGLGEVGGFEPGKWTFMLFAYEDSDFTKLLYQSSEVKATLEVNKPAVTLKFPVSKVKIDGQKGALEIVTSGADAITLKSAQITESFVLQDVTVRTTDGNIVTTLTSAESFTTELDAGTYNLSIRFVYQGAYYTAYPDVEIYSNFTTRVTGQIDARRYAVYTIEYMDKGGSAFSGNYVGNKPEKHTYGTVTLLPGAVKDYYDFDGWSTDSNWTTSITSLPASVYENTTLYAKWTPTPYTIVYDFNATVGLGEDPSLNKKNILTSYSSYNVETPAFTVDNPERTGFTFNGWSTGSDLSTTTLNLVFEQGSYGDRSYTANWREYMYTIHFSSNTDDPLTVGSMDDITGIRYLDKVNLTSAGFTRAGYTFMGWSFTADGTPEKADGAMVEKLTETDLAVVTLYAVWQANGDTTYTVLHFFENLFDDGYSTDSDLKEDEILHSTTTSLVYGTPVTAEGFTYLTTSTNSGNVIGDGSLVLSLYYKRNVHTLTWDFDGGSTEDAYTSSGDYKYGYPISDPFEENMKKTGYAFGGWNQTIPESMPDSNVAIKALWIGNEYTVSFDGNQSVGSSAVEGSTASQNRTYNETKKKLSDNGFKREGYEFTGWNTASDGSGTGYTTYTEYNNISTGSDVTLYAQWNANTYTISFDGNKGNGSSAVNGYTAPQSRVFDETEKVLSTNGFSRDGYTFTHWSTSADGTGTTYTDAKLCNNLSTGTDVVLYAQWRANTYTVSFDGNESVGSSTVNGNTPARNRVYDDEAVTMPNNFSRDGYTFTGWNTSSDGTGTAYTTCTTYTNLSTGTDVVLYAQWEADTYTLTLNPNNGFATTETVVTFDSNVITPFTVEKTTDTDLVFMGYYTTDNEATGTMVITSASCLAENVAQYTDENGKWIRTEGVTLYAVWHKNLSPAVYASTDVTLSFDSDAKFVATPEIKSGLKMKKGDTKIPYDVSKATCIGKDCILGFYTDTTFENKVLNGDGTVVTSTDIEGYIADGKWACTQASVTLYARWVDSSESELVIKFNANGGTGSMNDLTVPVPCTNAVALRTNSFTNFGKTFVGWNTIADGTGIWYGDSYKSSAWTSGTELVLYAQWTDASVSTSLFMPVNYVRNDNSRTAYLDTGYCLTDKDAYWIAFGASRMTTNMGVCGAFESGVIDRFTAIWNPSVSMYTAYRNGTDSKMLQVDGVLTAYDKNSIWTVYNSNTLLKFNNVELSFADTKEYTMTDTFKVFSCTGRNVGLLDVYGVKIIRDGIVTMNLIPCVLKNDIAVVNARNASEHNVGEVGMWDLIGNKFYGNSGSGSFTCELD